MYEIHIFTAQGNVVKDNKFGYPVGERHALLIFSRQVSNTEHDTELALSHAEKAGWSSIEINRAGTLNPENINGQGTESAQAFEEAMLNGSSLIVYRDPIRSYD